MDYHHGTGLLSMETECLGIRYESESDDIRAQRQITYEQR
jgi:hypothetical protein